MTQFDKTRFTYTPLFCEENIWKLIETFNTDSQVIPLDVLFIINKSNTVAIFEQYKSSGHQPVIWDYHVILSAIVQQQRYIFDFDSRCRFPVKIEEYFSATFADEKRIAEDYRPCIKSINASDYLTRFYSDRSHMINIISKTSFPAYNIIQPDSSIQPLSLSQCRDIQNTDASKIQSPEDYIRNNLHK